MRSLRLISCGLAAAILTATSAAAQSPSTPAAAESADRFTNRQLLEFTPEDRRMWLSAMMGGATAVAGLHDDASAVCVARWYFEDDGDVYRLILRSMETYPDHRPVEVVFALARRECPSFIPNGS